MDDVHFDDKGICDIYVESNQLKLDPLIRSPISLHNVLANLGSNFKLDCKLPNDKEHSILTCMFNRIMR